MKIATNRHGFSKCGEFGAMWRISPRVITLFQSQKGNYAMYVSKVNVDFWLRLEDFKILFCTKNFLFGFYNFPPKKFGDLPLSKLPLTNSTSSFSTTSTTSTSSIPSTNRRSTGLHPYIYSRLWLFQMRTSASGTVAEIICLFRTSLSFRVQRNIVPLWVFKFCHN